MGLHASKFIKLEDDDRAWLEQQWKSSPAHAVRSRAHAILLSAQRYSIVEISQILGVSYQAVEDWFARWNDKRRDGLRDAPRSGRPPKLDDEDRNVLREIAQEHPQQPAVMLSRLVERTEKSISRGTLRRTLRAFGFRWKRLRRSLKKRERSTNCILTRAIILTCGV
jgi:transposase